jgi:hypothetical protein
MVWLIFIIWLILASFYKMELKSYIRIYLIKYSLIFLYQKFQSLIFNRITSKFQPMTAKFSLRCYLLLSSQMSNNHENFLILLKTNFKFVNSQNGVNRRLPQSPRHNLEFGSFWLILIFSLAFSVPENLATLLGM